MGWANLSISSEIREIETIAKEINAKDPKTSDALKAIATALQKIEDAMDTVAYRSQNR
jgi:hypothetical protein